MTDQQQQKKEIREKISELDVRKGNYITAQARARGMSKWGEINAEVGEISTLLDTARHQLAYNEGTEELPSDVRLLNLEEISSKLVIAEERLNTLNAPSADVGHVTYSADSPLLAQVLPSRFQAAGAVDFASLKPLGASDAPLSAPESEPSGSSQSGSSQLAETKSTASALPPQSGTNTHPKAYGTLYFAVAGGGAFGVIEGLKLDPSWARWATVSVAGVAILAALVLLYRLATQPDVKEKIKKAGGVTQGAMGFFAGGAVLAVTYYGLPNFGETNLLGMPSKTVALGGFGVVLFLALMYLGFKAYQDSYGAKADPLSEQAALVAPRGPGSGDQS